MTQLRIETGKNKKLTPPDLFIKFYRISSNSTDQSNLETWTNMKNSVKLFFKNFLKYPKKLQEYTKKTRRFYKSKEKHLKWQINLKKKRRNRRKWERRKELDMEQITKTIRNGPLQNGCKTKNLEVSKSYELFRFLLVSLIVKFQSLTQELLKLLNLHVCCRLWKVH